MQQIPPTLSVVHVELVSMLCRLRQMESGILARQRAIANTPPVSDLAPFLEKFGNTLEDLQQSRRLLTSQLGAVQYEITRMLSHINAIRYDDYEEWLDRNQAFVYSLLRPIS